jgi:hypothetical protein
MTPPDKIERCDECGWTGEVRETCPDCELDERIRAADSLEIWAHACDLADHLRTALAATPYSNLRAHRAIKDWDLTKNAITNP